MSYDIEQMHLQGMKLTCTEDVNSKEVIKDDEERQ